MDHPRARKNNWQCKAWIYCGTLVISLVFIIDAQGGVSEGLGVVGAESISNSRYRSDPSHATVIHFLEISTETLVGVTPKTIESTSDYVLQFSQLWPLESPFPRFKEHAFVEHLRKQLVATEVNKRIDTNVIRLKIRFPESTYYVDQTGIVWKEGTDSYFFISERDLKDLAIQITGFIGVVDLKAKGTGN